MRGLGSAQPESMWDGDTGAAHPPSLTDAHLCVLSLAVVCGSEILMGLAPWKMV